jgi:hypothetical protein
MHHTDSFSDAKKGRDVNMKPVTLRNIPSEVDRIIRRRAEKQQMSLNKAVISLLEENVGRKRQKGNQPLHHDLDALAGSWSKEEAQTFESALAQQRIIDPGLWK